MLAWCTAAAAAKSRQSCPTLYFYRKDGGYYATYSAGKTDNIYDLSRESEQRRFFFDYVGKFRDAITMDKMKFEKYTMYDLIFNYKKIFKNF